MLSDNMSIFSSSEMRLDGVRIIDLTPHRDERGVLTEIFRESWNAGVQPRQWNVVHSEQNVLRGFHAHWQHSDYLTVVAGCMFLGLKDLRKDSPSFGKSASIVLKDEFHQAILIPPGVGHGFYFLQPSTHVYSVTHYWNPKDELGCRWDDPDLKIDWPATNPTISEHDDQLPNLNTLMVLLAEKLSSKLTHDGTQ